VQFTLAFLAHRDDDGIPHGCIHDVEQHLPAVACGNLTCNATSGVAVTSRHLPYRDLSRAPATVAAMPGWVLLDFGTDWCGHCIAARSAIDAWRDAHPEIEHLRIEDGRGRPLGRAYQVKLWPTLILLRDGREAARVVRPREARDLWPLEQALA